MKKVLSNKLFMTSLVSDMISNLGDTMFYLVFMNYILVLDSAQATLAVSIISLSEMIPMLSGIFVGDLADRSSHKVSRIMLTQIFRFGAYLLVGSLMFFTPALWIALFVAFVNFLSDLAGQYESSLFIPISLAIVTNEDREDAVAFRQTVSSTLSLVFLGAGGVLVGLMPYWQIGYLNALTFLASFGLMVSISKPLRILVPDHVGEAKEKNRFVDRLKSAYAGLKGYPELLRAVFVLTFVNGCFAGLNTLFVLVIKENPNFILVNAPFTIAVVSMFISVCNILGSALAFLFKKWTFYQELSLSLAGGAFIYVGFLMGNIYVTLLGMAVAVIVAAAVRPKFFASLMNQLPEENLALTVRGLETLLTLGIVVLNGGTALALNVLALNWIVAFYLLLSLLVTAYLVYMALKEKGKSGQAADQA